MNHRMKSIMAVVVCAVSLAPAQLRVVAIERLPLDSFHQWSQPRFSPDGKSIYYTSSDFNGIWEYSTETRVARNITTDPRSGFAFAISDDGSKLAYRRTVREAGEADRIQEIAVADLRDGASSVLASGSDLSAPVFIRNEVSYAVDSKTQHLPTQAVSAGIVILGIENTKISVSQSGRKSLFDPFGNGSYVWASLSPDGQRILAYEMNKGTFTCTPDGKEIVLLGRRDAPCWTHDGKWIVFMDDKDDGQKLLSSRIMAISSDGKEQIALTTDNGVALYPHCSPTENKVVYCTADGTLNVLSYTEVSR